MSWLDDMEAADPAYPGPDPGPPARQVQDWNERNAHADGFEPRADPGPGPERPWLILDADGNLFGDYRSKADRDHALAPHVTAGELVWTSHWDPGGNYGSGWSDPQPFPVTTTGPDWRALRQAETRARDAGLRTSVPQPDGHGTPEYQADAAAWGTGRGIGPDGPEAG